MDDNGYNNGCLCWNDSFETWETVCICVGKASLKLVKRYVTRASARGAANSRASVLESLAETREDFWLVLGKPV